jgi:hypothetical protein
LKSTVKEAGARYLISEATPVMPKGSWEFQRPQRAEGCDTLGSELEQEKSSWERLGAESTRSNEANGKRGRWDCGGQVVG